MDKKEIISWSYPNTVLVLCSTVWFMVYLYRSVTPPLLPLIEDSFKITHIQAGFAVTLQWFAYALMQFPSGVLSDRFDKRNLIVVTTISFSSVVFLIGMANDYLEFLFLITMLGATTGTYLPVGINLISDTFYAKRGLPIGIHFTFSSIAGVLTPVLATSIAISFNWRWVYFLVSIPGFAIAFLFYKKVLKQPRVKKRKPLPKFSQIKKALLDPSILITMVASGLINFSSHAFVTFLPSFLLFYKALELRQVGVLSAVPFVAGVFSKLFGGWLSDRFGKVKVMATIIFISGVSLLFLPGFSSILLIIACLILAGIGVSGYWPVLTAYLMDVFPVNVRGGHMGFFLLVNC